MYIDILFKVIEYHNDFRKMSYQNTVKGILKTLERLAEFAQVNNKISCVTHIVHVLIYKI